MAWVLSGNAKRPSISPVETTDFPPETFPSSRLMTVAFLRLRVTIDEPLVALIVIFLARNTSSSLPFSTASFRVTSLNDAVRTFTFSTVGSLSVGCGDKVPPFKVDEITVPLTNCTPLTKVYEASSFRVTVALLTVASLIGPAFNLEALPILWDFFSADLRVPPVAVPPLAEVESFPNVAVTITPVRLSFFQRKSLICHWEREIGFFFSPFNVAPETRAFWGNICFSSCVVVPSRIHALVMLALVRVKLLLLLAIITGFFSRSISIVGLLPSAHVKITGPESFARVPPVISGGLASLEDFHCTSWISPYRALSVPKTIFSEFWESVPSKIIWSSFLKILLVFIVCSKLDRTSEMVFLGINSPWFSFASSKERLDNSTASIFSPSILQNGESTAIFVQLVIVPCIVPSLNFPTIVSFILGVLPFSIVIVSFFPVVAFNE